MWDVTVGQVWWDDMTSEGGEPMPCGTAQSFLQMQAERVIHVRKRVNELTRPDGTVEQVTRLSWLMQSGTGENARFTYVPYAAIKDGVTSYSGMVQKVIGK